MATTPHPQLPHIPTGVYMRDKTERAGMWDSRIPWLESNRELLEAIQDAGPRSVFQGDAGAPGAPRLEAAPASVPPAEETDSATLPPAAAVDGAPAGEGGEEASERSRKAALARQRGRNPILVAIILGTADPDSILHKLRGLPGVIDLVVEEVERYWAAHVRTGGVSAVVCGQVSFPPPLGLNVNMMPFVIGSKASLPIELQPYAPMIAACPVPRDEWGRIGYLTVHESLVTEDGHSQRRPGLHTEAPPANLCEAAAGTFYDMEGMPLTLAWGRGTYVGPPEARNWTGRFPRGPKVLPGELQGGIFMASNVGGSTRVWNAQVEREGLHEVSGPLGDIEHLRSHLGPGEAIGANQLVWITDTTPHESLPLRKGTYRQYFRLVTSGIDVWYEDHSTRSPFHDLGVRPGDEVCIVSGDKFAGGCDQAVPQ
mmetsp:Transcript_14784/g.43430  ORF Transcript_14784/g.43430 Transcript_14784/m.43430 type:complete len:427 (+) Transcript_14784:98-1378(+)